MSKADAWMPLYVADYLADTARLTTEQHGAYLLLIMDYWRNGPAPDDDAVLAQIVRLEWKSWSRHRPAIQRFFRVEGGLWRHKRIDEERSRADRVSAARREAGAKGGRPRKQTITGVEPIAYAKENQLVSQLRSQTETQSQSQSPPPSEVDNRAALQREAYPVEDDWPEADGDGKRAIATWAARLSGLAGPALADPAKTPSLLTSSVEIGRWRQAGCSWEVDVVPVIQARTAQPRAKPINAWSYFTPAILEQASRRKASLVIPLHPESPAHVRPSAPSRPSRRQTDYAERLSRIDAAMAAAVEPAAGGRRG